MVNAIDKKKLGDILRALRISRGLTQQEVEESTFISTETLRRIENGRNIPNLVTMERLSNIYKVDVVRILMHLKNSNEYYEYYEKLDRIIIGYDLDKLQMVYKKFLSYSQEGDYEYFNDIEIEQFKLILSGLEIYYRNNSPIEESTECFIQAIKLKYNSFILKKYKSYEYSHLDLKALFLISMNYCDEKKYQLSTEMLLFIIEEKLLEFDVISSNLYFKFFIKSILNISYNYYCMSEFEKSLEYANVGIDSSRKEDSSYLLYSLYFRKGVALLKLGRDYEDYIDSFEKSLCLIDLQGDEKLLSIYKKVSKEKYNINI